MFKKLNNEEKLTDQAFMKMICISIAFIVLCMAGLCSTTWAWFTGSIESESNTITAGSCELKVTVSEIGLTKSQPLVSIEDMTAESHRLTAGEYVVELSVPDGSASGYCMILANGDIYRTEHVSDTAAEIDKISFTLKLEEDTTVVFEPRWGIYSGDVSVSDGGVLYIPAVTK